MRIENNNVFFYGQDHSETKKSFTFMEVLAVIIVMAIFATLAVGQYSNFIERPRGAEARGILPIIRYNAKAYFIETGSISMAGFPLAKAGIGTADFEAPSSCRSSHFFSYSININNPWISITATRCGAAGKPPFTPFAVGRTLQLRSNLATNSDQWTGTGQY